MRCSIVVAGVLAAFLGGAAVSRAQEGAAIGPAAHVFASPGGVPLKAHVFALTGQKTGERRAAIVVFHGGGWSEGEPEWAFARARHFAARGLIAVAAQYRLSDQKTVTPLDAMADARAVIRWMRTQAGSLGSTLVGSSRTAGQPALTSPPPRPSSAIRQQRTSRAPRRTRSSSCPPRVSLESDSWAQRLLGQHGNVRDISPDEHMRAGLPPTLILQGSTDTVTPLAGVQRFCSRMKAAGNTCELHVYEGFGHLFTPAGIPDNGQPQPDAATRSDALVRAERFLKSLGYIK